VDSRISNDVGGGFDQQFATQQWRRLQQNRMSFTTEQVSCFTACIHYIQVDTRSSGDGGGGFRQPPAPQQPRPPAAAAPLRVELPPQQQDPTGGPGSRSPALPDSLGSVEAALDDMSLSSDGSEVHLCLFEHIFTQSFDS